MNWLVIWLIIIIITIAVELLTVGLTSIWFTLGALAALVCAGLNAPLWLQIIVFLGVTSVSLGVTRPIAVKYLNKKRVNTNVDAVIGSNVRITEPVNNSRETGKALLNGMDWTARAKEPEETFEKDEIARVHSVRGVKLILEKLR